MEAVFINKYPKIVSAVLRELDMRPDLQDCGDRLLDKIIRRIERYIAKNEEVNSKHLGVVRRIARRELSQATKERKKVIHYELFAGLSSNEDFGESSSEFEPKDSDVLADVEHVVEGNFLYKQEIARLAPDDQEMFILKAWMDGYNDSEISKMLAHRFGGKAPSLRITIIRFKKKCQKQLTA